MNDLELNEPVFFDIDDKLIKNIIKEQGNISCRDNFHYSYIQWCLKNFTYGYVILGRMASIGKSNRSKKDYYLLKGYIMFLFDPNNSTIDGRIFCVRESNKGIGNSLLDSVHNFALNNGVTMWKIKSLPFEKLIKYYEKYGFKKSLEIYNKKGKLKVHEIIKN